MSPDNIANVPATPRRMTPMKALSSLFRTPAHPRTPAMVSRGNKRARARTSSLSSTPSTPSIPSLPAVVLQTYSVSTDSIVLTALQSAPFCCHEDLLTMSRTQLEAVVHALNARLPRRMRIGPEDSFWQDEDEDCIGDGDDDDDDDGVSRMSEAEMRVRIEELVGIRAVVGKNRVSRSGLGLGTRSGVPSAPKAVRTRDAAWRPCERTPWEMEVDAAEDRSDDLGTMIEDAIMGSSPLAGRTKSGLHVHGRGNTLPRLAILQEENEGGESKEDDASDDENRPSKRQRVSLGSVTRDSEGGSQVVEGNRDSRLIENMDLSGSPLMARDDDTTSEDLIERNETVVTTTIDRDGATTTLEEAVKAPLQRRSARIKEIALRRTSSVDTKRATSTARDLKPYILRSKTLSSSRCSRNISAFIGGSDTRKDSGTLKELTIRLPFASTPPHEKLDSSAWSASRILRSNSQRLLNSSQSAKTKASLGRSQSERYPRASDLAFVTINRPRYRFTRRKSKGAEVVNENQASHPSLLASPGHGACQPQQVGQTGAEHLDWKHEYEKENEDPKVHTGNSTISDLHTLPSAFCSLLAPRSRAPSTSTVASTRGNCGDSPVQTIVKEETVPTVITDSVVSDGTTERVWEALGRMAVESV